MRVARPKVLDGASKVHPEPFHLEAEAQGEAGKAAKVAHFGLFAEQVVIAKPYAEIFLPAQHKLAIEDEVPGEVVKFWAVVVGAFFSKKEGVFLRVGVVVADVPAVEVAVNDG